MHTAEETIMLIEMHFKNDNYYKHSNEHTRT